MAITRRRAIWRVRQRSDRPANCARSTATGWRGTHEPVALGRSPAQVIERWYPQSVVRENGFVIETVATDVPDQSIGARYRAVCDRVAAAARRALRDPNEVTVIAVSKGHSVLAIREAIAAGAVALGENRVQEAVEKIEAIGRSPEWHLIGALQTNKVKAAIDYLDVVHSVDRVELGRAVSSRAATVGRRCRVLIQVNVTGKQTQGGVAVDGLEELVRGSVDLPGLLLDGLMCIAPETSEVGGPEGTREAFREVARRWRDLSPIARDHGHPWHHLSMGMTGDFDVAIEEGATLVRVGRAIFGDRST